VAIRIALASQDVDESGSDALHNKGDGILRANALWLARRGNHADKFRQYADAATLKGVRVRRN
jgi:hypothetical protein